jgi:hypothetical protein
MAEADYYSLPLAVVILFSCISSKRVESRRTWYSQSLARLSFPLLETFQIGTWRRRECNIGPDSLDRT